MSKKGPQKSIFYIAILKVCVPVEKMGDATFCAELCEEFGDSIDAVGEFDMLSERFVELEVAEIKVQDTEGGVATLTVPIQSMNKFEVIESEKPKDPPIVPSTAATVPAVTSTVAESVPDVKIDTISPHLKE